MKIFNPYIFDVNDSIKSKKLEKGFQFFNIFKYPNELVEYCKNNLLFQNSSERQGSAPVYRGFLPHKIPPLEYFIKTILDVYMDITYVKDCRFVFNVQPYKLYKNHLHCFPHLDGCDLSFMFYLSNHSGTIVWQTEDEKEKDYYNAVYDIDNVDVSKQYFEKQFKSSGTFNSGFIFHSKVERHTIDYWDHSSEEDRYTLIAFIHTQ